MALPLYRVWYLYLKKKTDEVRKGGGRDIVVRDRKSVV